MVNADEYLSMLTFQVPSLFPVCLPAGPGHHRTDSILEVRRVQVHQPLHAYLVFLGVHAVLVYQVHLFQEVQDNLVHLEDQEAPRILRQEVRCLPGVLCLPLFPMVLLVRGGRAVQGTHGVPFLLVLQGLPLVPWVPGFLSSQGDPFLEVLAVLADRRSTQTTDL